MSKCNHNEVTSTFEKGAYCCQCKEPLISIFNAVSRRTVSGAVLYAVRTMPNPTKEIV